MEVEENTALREAIDSVRKQLSNNRAKLGLILDLNPWWLYLCRLNDSGFDIPDFVKLVYWLDQYNRNFVLDLPLSTQRLPELSRRFSGFDHVSEIFGPWLDGQEQLQPFVLRIVARPDYNDAEHHAIEYDQYQQLIEVARNAALPTFIETHPLPALLSACGTRIQSKNGAMGTLGGYLKDARNGSVYGVTCGHVVSQAALSSSGELFGLVKHVKQPTPLPPNVFCEQSCGYVTKLDVALIPVVNAPNSATKSIAQRVGNGQLVTMDGATTFGVPTYQIGAHVIEYEIASTCWENLIQFHSPAAGRYGIFPTWFNMALGKLPSPGDSGAWLIRNGCEWAGMVVAANHIFGFALSSTSIIENCEAEFNTNLCI